jgi:hypothetical protein
MVLPVMLAYCPAVAEVLPLVGVYLLPHEGFFGRAATVRERGDSSFRATINLCRSLTVAAPRTTFWNRL